MPEEAVLEASPDTGAELSSDVTTGGDQDTSVDTQTSDSTDQQTGDQTTAQKPLQLLQDRNGQKVLNPEARKQIDELIKTADPKQQAVLRAMRSTLFDQARQLSAVGPVQEVREKLQQIEQLGGLDAIGELQEGHQYYSNLQKQFENGDPEFVRELTYSPKEQAAFAQHAPAMISKWAELQPDSHASYVAQVTLDYMNRAGMTLALDRLADFLPADQPRAQEAYQRVMAVLTGLNQMAEKPLAPARQALAEPDDTRERELASREAKLKEQEWNGRTEKIGTQIRESELKRVLNGRTMDADTEQAVLANIHLKLTELLPSDFDAKMQKLYDTGQMDAFLKLYRSTMQSIAPKAVAWAVKVTAFPNKPGPKPGQQRQNGTQGARRAENPTGAQPQAGFKMVSAYPVGKIDVIRTTKSMLAAKTAILKDGSKVQWR